MIKPVETVTQNMVDVQVTRIQQLEQERQRVIRERLTELDKKMDDTSAWSIGQYLSLVVEKQRLYLQEGFDTLLKNLFYALFLAARLVILTSRSFFLIVLTIIGPLSFALAIFSGFQDSHVMWIARYVQISLWYPLANILGTIVSYLQGKVITLQYLEITNGVPPEAQSGPIDLHRLHDYCHAVLLHCTHHFQLHHFFIGRGWCPAADDQSIDGHHDGRDECGRQSGGQ